jgi:hypothetical protein
MAVFFAILRFGLYKSLIYGLAWEATLFLFAKAEKPAYRVWWSTLIIWQKPNNQIGFNSPNAINPYRKIAGFGEDVDNEALSLLFG